MNHSFTISPRFGISYRLFGQTYLNANSGVYYQTPEFLWLLASPDNANLMSIKAIQHIVGIEQYLPGDVKVTIEGYTKRYSFYPVSVYDPYYNFINAGVEISPSFIDKAESKGKGYFQGIDFCVQRKNNEKGPYASLTVSLTTSSFMAIAGREIPANFDYGKQLTFFGGWKFSGDFSVGIRFRYAGGRPYTPFDLEMSTLLREGYYQRFAYNTSRMPEYSRLDIRVDKTFSISDKSIVTYAEVINALNRDNIYRYSWGEHGLSAEPQLSIVPVIGLSVKL